MDSARGEQSDAHDLRWSGLMRAAQAGDKAAYDALLRDCVPFIRTVAGRAGVREDRLDDVVQETLLTLHRARQTYDPTRSFKAWLGTIAQRRAIDILRNTGRARRREVYAPTEFEAHADDAPSAEVLLGGADAGKQLTSALRDLSPLQREAVEHLALRELSLQEASVATGRTTGSLKVSLHRALKTLRASFGSGDLDR